MASASSSATPRLIIPEEKSVGETGDYRSSPTSSVLSSTVIPSPRGTTTKKLTKILSTQSSFERHPPPRPIFKRFSIDADPSSIILNTPITDFSNNTDRQPATPDAEDSPSTSTSSTSHAKEPLSVRSPSLKKSDSFLEIPYEKGEIVDLIKLADDPNAATHITNDGHEVLLEHGAAPS